MDVSDHQHFKNDCPNCTFIAHINGFDVHYCGGGTPAMVAKFADNGDKATYIEDLGRTSAEYRSRQTWLEAVYIGRMLMLKEKLGTKGG